MNRQIQYASRQYEDRSVDRRGAMLVLLSALTFVMFIMAAFTVDVAYMQLTKTQLRIATDAAAKAGTIALATSNGSDIAAIEAAMLAAAQNAVGDRKLKIGTSSIEVGGSQYQDDGSWSFVPEASPRTAVRVNSKMIKGSISGSVDLFFGGAIGVTKFQPLETATAAQVEIDMALAIDRSHSMCFDLTGTNWIYPPEHPIDPTPLAFGPRANTSRWGVLRNSIDNFVVALNETKVKPRTALVTWASLMDTTSYEYSVTGQTENVTTLEVDFTEDYAAIKTGIDARSDRAMIGATNMSAGIDHALSLLTGPSARVHAKKVMVLMSDGMWNQGRDPIEAATECVANKITVHCISFLDAVNQDTMIAISGMTGGKFYSASNEAELIAAWENIARTLPIALTE